MRIINSAARAATLCLACAVPSLGAPAIQALILTGHDQHDWRSTTPYLRQLLTDTGRFEVRVEEEPAGITAATLSKFDVLILHYNGVRWPADTEKAVLDFVRGGKGAVALHASAYTFGGFKEWSKLIGGEYPKPPITGDAGRKVFTVKFSEPRHAITADLPPTFKISDELYHNPRMEPGIEVLASAYDSTTQRDEPQLWVHRYGKGRVCYTAWGHDLSSMQEPAFGATFTRAAEWAATGKVDPQVKAEPSLRILVVTGGHPFETSFYRLFDSFHWTHAVTNVEAFKKDIRKDYDVLVLYDWETNIGEREKQNLEDFVESNKGLVVLHHALGDYNDWPWWYHDVMGGKYQRTATPEQPASTFIHGRDQVIHPAMDPGTAHPILTGGKDMTGLAMWDIHITDETFKGLWISPDVKVLLRSDDPTSDGPVAWISPYPKSRVVCIQLGHDHLAHEHPAYRDLVKNAILWAGGRL